MYSNRLKWFAIFFIVVQFLLAGWEHIVSPKGGNIYIVTVNRENEEIIFAVSYSKVYKSNDGGVNWYICLEESSVSDIFQLAPSNQDVIYTENWKSTDGGESWFSISPIPNQPGNYYDIQIGINPSNSDLVFCGTSYYIYKTTNGGESWSIIDTLGHQINKIVYNDNDSSTLYAFGEGQHIYKSLDNGDTWAYISNDIPYYSVLKIIISNSHLYAINWYYGGTNDQDYILIKSSDGGNTWNELALNQTNYDISVITDISIFNNMIYVSTDRGLFFSVDDGATWSRISPDYDFLNTVDVYNSIFIGSSRCGVSKSSLLGNDWSNIGVESFTSHDKTSIVTSGNGVTLLKDKYFGIYKYLPDSQKWKTNIPPSGDSYSYTNYALEFSQQDEEKLFCAVENKLYNSTNTGESWLFISEMPSDINTTNIAISNDDNKLFFNGGSSVIRSLNGGESWSIKTIPGSGLYDIHYSDENILYIFDNTGLYYSSNNGNVWNALDENLPVDYNLWGTEISYDINNNDRLFCFVTAPSTGYGDVYEKPSSSNNWILLYSEDEIILGSKFIVEPNNNHIYTSGQWYSTFWENSLFRSNDGGNSWVLSSNQFQFTSSNYTFSNFDPYLLWYIDSSGELWTGDVQNMSGLSIDNENILTPKYYLYDAYPNPFNPTTTISYQIAEQKLVNISIYNMSGQLVENLVNSVKAPGSYSVNWKANNVSSGLYIYKLKAGDKTLSKKMILVK